MIDMAMTETGKFQVSCDKNILDIVFSSSLENIDRVDKETKKFLNQIGLEQNTFTICLGLREALTNAIKHGHHFDFNKKVHFSLRALDDRLIMEIEDQGEGFDWRAIHARQPGLTSEHGRGLAIIRQFFSKYSFNERGNKIVLIKDRVP